MNSVRASTASVRQLEQDISGRIIRRDDPAYEGLRTVYNTMHDRWPALIVRAAAVGDVARTVRFAAEEGTLLAVRGGNHSMRGHGSCDDGVVLDLGALDSVRVDEREQVARVGGGATWGEVNDATHAHGLATTGGLISTTGVGGLTLGGGFGYLTRQLGLACDRVRRAEIVVANGEILTVDVAHHPDLFRAIRGGGGNFGIVTSFEFELAPIGPTILGGPIVFAPDAGVLRNYADLLEDAPRELGAILGFTLTPPLPFIETQHHGKPCAVVMVCWTGEPSKGQALIDRILGFGPLRGHGVHSMPYREINTLFDGLLPAGLRHFWKSRFVESIPDDALHAYADHGCATPTPESGIFFYPINGAAHDIGPDETAWSHRDARFLVGFHGSWKNRADDEAILDWVGRAWQACQPSAGDGEYVNFASGDGAAAADYGTHYERLVEVKRRYDPHNLFCLNANIEPDGAARR